MAVRIGSFLGTTTVLTPILALLVLSPCDIACAALFGHEENVEQLSQRDVNDDADRVGHEDLIDDTNDIDMDNDDGIATTIEYGVDVSFPMQHAKVSNNFAWLQHNTDPTSYSTPRELKGKPISPLPDRQDFYDQYLQGCVDFFGAKGRNCLATEKDRIAMTFRQPQSMQNYTESGFKKIRAPDELFQLISDFWKKNKDIQSIENWGAGNTYTNNWKAPTYMVSVDDRKLRSGGHMLKQNIWRHAQAILQEWTGQQLTPCSLYGIRVYKTDAVLAPHVDRLPLVTSAIINVDADLDEPWPLEVISHDGKATNVTMIPGDMVLYESHSLIHGRPFPLKGRYVANIFIHFEPTGHTLRHNAAHLAPNEREDVDERYRKSVQKGIGGHESAASDEEIVLPPYLIPGSLEEPYWRREHNIGWSSNLPILLRDFFLFTVHFCFPFMGCFSVPLHLVFLLCSVCTCNFSMFYFLYKKKRKKKKSV